LVFVNELNGDVDIMSKISETLDQIDKVASIFTHIKNLLIVICIIVVLVFAWKAWRWMDVQSDKIPNLPSREAVTERVAGAKETLSNIELPDMSGVKERAGQIRDYRPGWLSSGNKEEEGESQNENGGQVQEEQANIADVDGADEGQTAQAAGVGEQPEKPSFLSRLRRNNNQAQVQEEPSVTSADTSSENSSDGQNDTEPASVSFSSRLGRIGENVGGMVDRVDENIQLARDSVDPLLERTEELTAIWANRSGTTDNQEESNEEKGEQEKELNTGDEEVAVQESPAEEVQAEASQTEQMDANPETVQTSRSSHSSSRSSSRWRRALDRLD